MEEVTVNYQLSLSTLNLEILNYVYICSGLNTIGMKYIIGLKRGWPSSFHLILSSSSSVLLSSSHPPLFPLLC